MNPKKLHAKKVLITGAGGFIGSHLSACLTKAGTDIRALAHYNSRGDMGNLGFLPEDLASEMEIIAGDVCDERFMRSAMRDREIIFHLAAQISVPYSYVAPRSCLLTNILGTQNVLDIALELKIPWIVLISSSEVYGTADKTPISEDYPLNAQSPYAASKIAADHVGLSYHRSFGSPVTIVRPFNTYGPGQSARSIIPTLITQALTSDEIHAGNLDPVRDFCFVDDTVQGIIACSAAQECLGQVINLASGRGISMGELAQMILDKTGSSAKILTDSQRIRPEKSEVFDLVGNAEKAKRLTGWTPTVSLEEGLDRTISWIREHLSFYTVGKYQI